MCDSMKQGQLEQCLVLSPEAGNVKGYCHRSLIYSSWSDLTSAYLMGSRQLFIASVCSTLTGLCTPAVPVNYSRASIEGPLDSFILQKDDMIFKETKLSKLKCPQRGC